MTLEIFSRETSFILTVKTEWQPSEGERQARGCFWLQVCPLTQMAFAGAWDARQGRPPKSP